MMCACEPGFVCQRCYDTPLDDRYEEQEPPEPEAVYSVMLGEE